MSGRCPYTRAEILTAVGERDEALAAIDRAIALFPEKAPIQKLMARRRKIELTRATAPVGACSCRAGGPAGNAVWLVGGAVLVLAWRRAMRGRT